MTWFKSALRAIEKPIVTKICTILGEMLDLIEAVQDAAVDENLTVEEAMIIFAKLSDLIKAVTKSVKKL